MKLYRLKASVTEDQIASIHLLAYSSDLRADRFYLQGDGYKCGVNKIETKDYKGQKHSYFLPPDWLEEVDGGDKDNSDHLAFLDYFNSVGGDRKSMSRTWLAAIEYERGRK